jgi:hypothetical protein
MKLHPGIAGLSVLLAGISLILVGGIKLFSASRGRDPQLAAPIKRLFVPAILLGGICVVLAVLLFTGEIVP